MLSIDKINAGYGKVRVLCDISLEINEGEFVALLGSNGAGKSTVLKVISGMLRPTSGSVRLDGVDLTTLRAHKIVEQGIIQVPEGRQLFPKMTVLENLLIGGNNPKAKAARENSLNKVWHLFPVLEERKNQMAGTLSGGEQQMLAVGRGVMARPKILLLDEPSLGLGPILVTNVFKVLEEVNRDGITILLVEQNVKLSLNFSNRAYVLENGRIVMSGDSHQLLNDEAVKKAYLGI